MFETHLLSRWTKKKKEHFFRSPDATLLQQLIEFSLYILISCRGNRCVLLLMQLLRGNFQFTDKMLILLINLWKLISIRGRAFSFRPAKLWHLSFWNWTKFNIGHLPCNANKCERQKKMANDKWCLTICLIRANDSRNEKSISKFNR